MEQIFFSVMRLVKKPGQGVSLLEYAGESLQPVDISSKSWRREQSSLHVAVGEFFLWQLAAKSVFLLHCLEAAGWRPPQVGGHRYLFVLP